MFTSYVRTNVMHAHAIIPKCGRNLEPTAGLAERFASKHVNVNVRKYCFVSRSGLTPIPSPIEYYPFVGQFDPVMLMITLYGNCAHIIFL